MLSKKLLGTLVVIAAAVVVPASAAARGSDPAVRSFSMDETGILAATTLADDGATLGATASAAPTRRLLVQDAVTVGRDGNGVSTASFAGVATSRVRYVLVVENGCRDAAGTEPCPSPVNTLSVTLNDQIVFQADSPFADHRARLPADALAASQDNRLTITAAGAPRSAARVRILAVPAPTRRLLVQDAVTVGRDGNGASTASFAGVATSRVRYVLVVENGCRDAAGTEPCPSPVNTLSVTLNDQIVFQADSPFADHRARLPADALAASQDNRLTITAAGAPRSAARVRILAVPAPTRRLLVQDAVTVGRDGNGASTASFAGVATSRVRYVLVVENGCRDAAGTEPCPSPVNTLSVTLNDQIVFQADSPFADHRARLPADALAASQDNRLTITAAGAPRSAARVRILAVPAPTRREHSRARPGRRRPDAIVGAAPKARTVFLALQETTQMENRRR